MSSCSPETTLIILTPADDGDGADTDDSDAPRRRMTELFGLWGELKQICAETMYRVVCYSAYIIVQIYIDIKCVIKIKPTKSDYFPFEI